MQKERKEEPVNTGDPRNFPNHSLEDPEGAVALRAHCVHLILEPGRRLRKFRRTSSHNLGIGRTSLVLPARHLVCLLFYRVLVHLYRVAFSLCNE